MPFRVDLMVWDEVPENFRKNILQQYLVLVEKPAEKLQRDLAVSEWRPSTWGEEISLEYGKSLRGYENAAGQYRVFGSNGPIGWTDKFLAQGPGVILGRKGAYRGVHFSPDPFFVIDTAYYVVPKTELDMRWLYYAIKHYKLGEIDDGSPIPSTTRAAVYIQDLEVPPIDEQRAIAHILGTLDDKIELNRRMNETLEAMARALFKSWFVIFEPVRAKAEGRDTGLPKEIADLFPDSFEDSELGEVPKGWRVSSAGELFDVTIGRTPPRKEHHWFSTNAEDIPWMSIKDLGNAGAYISSVNEFLTTEAVENFRIKRIPDGTVVLSFKLTLGRVAITDGEMLSNEAIAHFNPRKQQFIGKEFLYCYLQQFDYDRLGSTSSIATAINSDNVRSIPILVPSHSTDDLFQRVTSPIFQQLKNLQRESRTLAAQRDALLPKLLSGELNLSNVKEDRP